MAQDSIIETASQAVSGRPVASSTTGLDQKKEDTGDLPTDAGAAPPECKAWQCLPTACITCRTRHLKCDRQYPCSRCVNSGSDCTFVASRRGHNRLRPAAPSQNDHGDAVQASRPPPSLDDGSPNHTSPPTAAADTSAAANSLLADDMTAYLALIGQQPASLQCQPSTHLGAMVGEPEPQSGPANDGAGVGFFQTSVAERCIRSFYHYFHAAHPFVLPDKFIRQLAPERSLSLLFSAMRWVGSLYIDIPSSARATLFEEARQEIGNSNSLRDGFFIQATMLLAIGLDGMCRYDAANKLLRDAEHVAIEIALHTRSFAAIHGQGVPVLEESWRRTWWDLYVTGAMVAGVHRTRSFTLFDAQTDVALPCEEWQYQSGAIPTPKCLDDLETNDFSGDDDIPSSFSYRVLCARNLGRLLSLQPTMGPHDEALSRIEALLTNWRLHLPPSKKDAVSVDGSLDEMMFQAHMILHSTSILLHYPYSRLDSSPARSVDSCAPNQIELEPTGFGVNTHTRHALASANEVSNLIIHGAPLASHTPFFSCVIVLGSIVHLNRSGSSSVYSDDDEEEDSRWQQIRLEIGALTKLSRVWRSAAIAREQINRVAKDTHSSKKRQQEEGDRVASGFWNGITQEPLLENIAVDGSLVGDTQLQ